MVKQLIFFGLTSLIIAATPLFFPFARNLEYEYSLLLGLTALFVAPLAGFLVPLQVFVHPQKQDLQKNLWQSAIWSLLFINVIPASYFLSGYCLCSKSGYLFWFLLNSLCSLVLAYGVLLLVLKSRVRNIKIKCSMFLGLSFILLTSHLVGSLWFYPQKRITHLIFGFLHGPIYDKWIPVDEGILWARLAHLMIAFFLVSLLVRARKIRALTFCTFLLCSTIASHYPSTQQGTESLESYLSETLEGPHFTIHYQKSKNSKNQASILHLKGEIEFHIKELSKQLGIVPSQSIKVYVYPDRSTKKLLFGGYHTAITDVQTPSIHLTLGASPNPIIRHELVHALGSQLRLGALKFHPNIAITEGLAVALAPEQHFLSLDERAASILKSGRIQNLEEIMSPLFWLHDSGRSYTLAGSFLRYIRDHHGASSLKRLYQGQSLNTISSVSQKQLISNWQSLILSKYEESRYSLYTEKLYRYPGVLKDTCPHSKVDLDPLYATRSLMYLRTPLGWKPHTDYDLWLEPLQNKNKKHKLIELQKEINDYAQQTYHTEEKNLAHLRKIESHITKSPTHYEDFELMLLYSDFLLYMDQEVESQQVLSQLNQLKKTKFLGPILTRHLDIRDHLRQISSQDRKSWRLYLAGWKQIPSSRLEHSHWAINYLILKYLDSHDRLEVKKVSWQNSPPPSTYSDETQAEWYRTIAVNLMKKGEFKQAAKAWHKMAKLAPQGSTESIRLMERLGIYMEENKSSLTPELSR